MKLRALIAMVVLASALDAQTLTVCLDNHSSAPHLVTAIAQLQAGRIFAAIGVNVVWRNGATGSYRTAAPGSLVVTITDGTPPEFRPGALAAALPFEGTHIRILYDRLTALNPSLPQAAMLLAHAMAHEITHMLQGTNRHSASGVMRAQWTHDDYVAMQRGELRFEPFDIELIRRGLAIRRTRDIVAMSSKPAAE